MGDLSVPLRDEVAPHGYSQTNHRCRSVLLSWERGPDPAWRFCPGWSKLEHEVSSARPHSNIGDTARAFSPSGHMTCEFQNTKKLELAFRALLTEGGTQRLELARS